ncbi:hypothetical protein HDK90DRAFT_501077 [Phyllosticta capitalensis]|uniref:DUF4038 domain-containing protein n=1 Tax=Phyllosticta capitalensis TaxID=121624 RepID=A0ABR1Z4D7_9PEZI
MVLGSRFGALAAIVTSAIAAAVPSAVPWSNLAISAPENGRYLHRTKTGEPFMWVADTNWELFHRLNRTDTDLYLANRAAKGFNVIQAVIVSKYNATTLPNFYGDLVFDDADPTRPNENYFSFVDWVTTRAAEYGILICFVPTWSRWVNHGWYGTESEVLFDESNAEVFGYFLGTRYPGIPKMMGGDTNAFWADNVPQARAAWRENPSADPTSFLGPITDTRPVWAAMMRGFKKGEAELGYDAFVTYQPTSPWISDPPTPRPYGHNYINGSFGLLSMDAVQSGHELPDPEGIDANFTVLTPWDSTKNYENIIEMRSQFAGPVMDVENHYEAANIAFNTSKPFWNASDVRHGFYSAVFSGACGYTYGSLPVQQSYERLDGVASPEHYVEPQLSLSADASWHEALHLPGAKQTGYVWKLFSSLSRELFDALEPARQFISSPDGQQDDVLAYEQNRYVSGIVTTGHYWVYSGYGDAFQLDLDAISAKWGEPGALVEAHWFDPRSAERQAVDDEEAFSASGKKGFTPPSAGGVDHDWVLVMKAKGACA